MSKLIVKITLNPTDPFDLVILNRIKHEANKAAVLKHIAYEAIKGRINLNALPEEEPVVDLTETVPAVSTRVDAMEWDINQKADRLLENL